MAVSPAGLAPGRAGRTQAASRRVRPALGIRRHPAGAAFDARRAALAGDRTRRGRLAGLGAAPGDLGRYRMVVSPGAGRDCRGVDPTWHRCLADGVRPWQLVPAGRTRQRRLGPGCVDLRRGIRGHARARRKRADRGARWRADLLRRGHPDRPARALLAGPQTRQARAPGHRRLSGRPGDTSGVAGPRILAGPDARAAWPAGGHGRADGSHQAAARPGTSRLRLRSARCRARLRDEPDSHARPGSLRSRPDHGPAGHCDTGRLPAAGVLPR